MIEEIKTYEERKKELIEKGTEAGYITYEQLATALKGLDLDSDSLDDLYNSLMEANIQVVTDEDLAGADEEENPDVCTPVSSCASFTATTSKSRSPSACPPVHAQESYKL